MAAKFDHLLVDEFQDLNPAQYLWLDLLAPDPESSLTVVGDPDQSIYGFRGGSPAFFDSLTQARPAARIFELKTSYRCPGPILSSALSLIKSNPGRHLDLSPSGRKDPRYIRPPWPRLGRRRCTSPRR